MWDDPMCIVVRVLRAPAASGLVVGQAEVVATGEVVTVRALSDFVALVERLAAAGAS